jgi:copper chaperone
MEKVVLQVAGMSCEHCVAAVKQACESIEGVKKAKVNLHSGKVELECDSAYAGLDAVKAAIIEAGYSLSK